MDSHQQIDELFSHDQFQMKQLEKESVLINILKTQLVKNCEFSPNLKKFYISYSTSIDKLQKINEIPPIPVNMFKKFELKTCPDSDIIRTMNSSATTTGTPSKIYINKETSFRQSKALVSTLKNFLGGHRRPVLVIDTQNVVKGANEAMSARGAAIRGIINFGKTVEYVMDEINGELVLNRERLEKFIETNKGQEILVSGFTYIIWTRFVKQLKESGLMLDFPQMKLVHSGGWKKLLAQAVDKKTFSESVAAVFNTQSENILDFYGMVEQLGVVFLDCPFGNKHVPDFADIIIRNFSSMQENPIKIPGLIEILSIIPTSYPGQAILTEDVGEIIGIDDCPCGRKGKYFQFRARVEKAETRGCGDTFAEKRKDK